MTELLYLRDQFTTTAAAQVEKIVIDDTVSLILNATIFYPQGGGQPCDTGTIASTTAKFQVTSVKKIDGIVNHFGRFLHGEMHPKETVTLSIDASKRKLHSRLQSAGHLVDAALHSLGLTHLEPLKGYHFPDGPYNEYQGIIDNPEEMKGKIEREANLLINRGLPVIVTFAPDGKTRFVTIKGYPPIPCGGTHVTSLQEIGSLTIRKLRSTKGLTRIAYAIA